MAFSALAQSSVALDSALSVFDPENMDSSLLARSFACLEIATSVLDLLALGSCLSSQTLSHCGPAVPALDLVHLDSLPLSRSSTYFEVSQFLFGRQRLGTPLLALDHALMGPFLSLQSLSKCGSAMLVLDISVLGLSLSLRSMVRLSSAMSCCGIHLGILLPILDCTGLGFLPSTRSFLCSGSLPLVWRLAHLALPVSTLDFGQPGLISFSHSSTCLDSAAPLLGLAKVEFLGLRLQCVALHGVS